MVAEVDLAFELYGPQAAGGRAGLCDSPLFAGPPFQRLGTWAAAVHFRSDARDILKPTRPSF